MMNPSDGETVLDIEVTEPELLSIELHYNMFLTQRPVQISLDNRNRNLDTESLKHLMLRPGNHTLAIKNKGLTLDETCVLISMVEYEVPISEIQINKIPGMTLRPGVQSIYIDSLEKGVTNLPLPNFKDFKNDTVFSSTLLLHFDAQNVRAQTPNMVELDINFETKKNFDFKSRMYYESFKDKMISYIDIADKEGSNVQKQIEVIQTKDFKFGSYLAHFVVYNGDQLANKFDVCNSMKKTNRIQSLDQDATFYYNDFGKEDFSLAINSKDAQTGSKFYDEDSNMFYIEFIYEAIYPSFIEFSVEFDISMQNVDLFVFQDFNDEQDLEDQQLVDSTLDIPSMLESTASRHTRIYLPKPGRYSIFLVDKKLPTIFKQMSEFEDEEPCAKLKISHSIQRFSPGQIAESSIGFLSAWPRRLELGDPFFVSTKRDLEIILYPNTLKINRQTPPEVKFAVIDLNTNKRLYVIEPDKTFVVVPTRKEIKNKVTYVGEIEVRCLFKAETLKNVIGTGRLLTLAFPEKMSDKSLVPYYVIVEGMTDKMKDMEITPNKTSSTQQVKEKLTLKQQREEMHKSLGAIQACYKTCKFGDCNRTGKCICKQGYTGVNCDQRHKIGKLDQVKQQNLDRVNSGTKKITSQSSTTDDDEDYDDEDLIFETILPSTEAQKGLTNNEKPSESREKSSSFGWFDFFLLFCLLMGIALIFYQNLWSGRFCRKKIYKKLKYDDEEDGERDEEDKAIITEELSFLGEEVELPRIRKRHED